MIKRALLLLLLTAVWAFGSWWYYTCMIKGFCRTDGAFTSASDRAKSIATTGTAAVAATAAGLANGDDQAKDSVDDTPVDEPSKAPEEKTQDQSSTEEPVTTKDPAVPETTEGTAEQAPAATTSEFVDQDSDAISDEDERRLGTDPEKDDSDGDGIKDNEELGADLQNPTDTDNDGVIDALDDDDDDDTLSTAQEISLGTDPRNADTDDDALSDALEAGDSKIGTDPLNPDTDNDGVSDGTEVGSDPSNPLDSDKDGTIDALDEDDDNDGIPTAIETKVNSDPLSQDSDGDGVSDSEEMGDDPSQPKDSDGDGIIDLIDSDSGEAKEAEGATEAPAENSSAEASEASDDEVTVSKSADSGDASSADIPIQKSRLYFPSRSANPGLSEAATKYFQEVADWLNADASHTVVLTGHTDNVGKAKNNLNLGLKRAVEIKNIMVKLGANASQIDVASMGETKPIASNKTDSGRRQNRRVELIPALKQ